MSDPKTTELLLKLEGEIFYCKFSPDAEAVPLSKEQMQAAYDAAMGPQKDIIAFLIDAAQGDPGKWHSGSAESLKPGQATI